MGNLCLRLAPCWPVALTDFERSVSRRLRDLRRKAGWTQEELADRIGIEPATLSRYENARVPLPIDVLARAAAALSVAPGALFGSDKDLPRGAAPRARARAARPPEERALLAAWAPLAPRDRGTVLALCQQLARRSRRRRPAR